MSSDLNSPFPIQPIPGPLSASVRVPGSKSLTNRALMAAALAEGATKLSNALFSDDSLYFAESLRRLGFQVDLDPGPDEAGPSRHMDTNSSMETLPSMTVTGMGGRIPAREANLFVGDAGTAARFLTAMLTLGNGVYTIDGDARMRQRPIQDLISALEILGAEISQPGSRDRPAKIPLQIQARGLPGGQARIAGDASSQFLSALLLAAPCARRPVDLAVERGLSSKPFVDMTLAVMADFGVKVGREAYDRFLVSPQKYISPGHYPIEPDATAASYFFAAAAICGGTVRVEGISQASKQGDLAFLDALTEMGCRVSAGPDWLAVTGPTGSIDKPALGGIAIDMSDISDTAQTLAAVAPFACAPTTIRGIASSRLKETDRVAAICNEMRRLGIRVDEHNDGLTIYPAVEIQPTEIHTYGDHRMAMAFSLIGLKVPGLTIQNPGCVTKTFPGFFRVLSSLQP